MPDTSKKILEFIAHLRQRTVERGFSESEAVAAAEKLAGILTEHDLTLDEVELRSSPFGMPEASFAGDVGERLWKVAAAVAALTGSRFWTTPNGVIPVTISFFGLEHETAVASYLLEICARAMQGETATAERSWVLFRQSVRRRNRSAFLDGMADRLAERIHALRPERPLGSGLVLVREGLIDAEMERRGLKLKDLRARPSHDFDPAYEDGCSAGDRVQLDPGLRGTSAPVGMIGHRATG